MLAKIGAAALLELAEWCRWRLEDSHGGEQCLTTTEDPGAKGGRASRPVDRTLETAADAGSARDRADCGADDRSADPAFRTEGGIA